jgi:hypothetical protein
LKASTRCAGGAFDASRCVWRVATTRRAWDPWRTASCALDDADPAARNVVELLDGIPGAYERAQLGLEQARAGETVSLDDL